MKNLSLLSLCLIVICLSSCTTEVGNLTVTYQQADAVYGDIDEVRNQVLNTTSTTLINPGKIYVAKDFILIGEEEKGIHVVDNSDIQNPNFVNFINLPGNREFFVDGDFLFAETYYDVVKIDISNPLNATLVNRAENVIQQEFTNNEGQTLLGFSFTEVTKEVDQNSNLYQEIQEKGIVFRDFAQNIIPKSAVPSSFAGNSNQSSGTVNRITYTNDHMYLIGNRSMHIIDDTDGLFRKRPQLHNLNLSEGLETIFPYQDKLFLGSRAAMDIYDISAPDAPTRIYNFSHATSCDPVLPTDEVAYITLRTGDFTECPGNFNALIVLDISNLQSPKEVQEIAMDSPFGMSLIGEHLYVGEGASGLKIFDVTDRLNPVLIKDDPSIEAYDIIDHPSNPNLVLIAGPEGINQYQIGQSFDLLLQSNIRY